MKDAIGELANITGGNVKLMLPDEAELQLPRVIFVDPSHPLQEEGRMVTKVNFECEGDPFSITIVQLEEKIKT